MHKFFASNNATGRTLVDEQRPKAKSVAELNAMREGLLEHCGVRLHEREWALSFLEGLELADSDVPAMPRLNMATSDPGSHALEQWKGYYASRLRGALQQWREAGDAFDDAEEDEAAPPMPPVFPTKSVTA